MESSSFPNLYYESQQAVLAGKLERLLPSLGLNFVTEVFVESAHSSGMHILNENSRLLRSHHSFLRSSNLRNVVQPSDSYEFLRSSFRLAGRANTFDVREYPPQDEGEGEDEDLVVMQSRPERQSRSRNYRRSEAKEVRDNFANYAIKAGERIVRRKRMAEALKQKEEKHRSANFQQPRTRFSSMPRAKRHFGTTSALPSPSQFRKSQFAPRSDSPGKDAANLRSIRMGEEQEVEPFSLPVIHGDVAAGKNREPRIRSRKPSDDKTLRHASPSKSAGSPHKPPRQVERQRDF